MSKVKPFVLTYLSLGIIPLLLQNVTRWPVCESDSVAAGNCSLTVTLMFEQVKSVLVMMGHDGEKCREFKVALGPGAEAG